MVGRDRTTLARAEAELGMESLQRNPQNNRRVGYSWGRSRRSGSILERCRGGMSRPIRRW